MRIDIELEQSPGQSQTYHVIDAHYRRKSAKDFKDLPARLTQRQAVFYRNLIRLAEKTGETIPVDFNLQGVDVHLDFGCIKIAAYAGFIEYPEDGPNGVVDEIRLRWRVDGTIVTP